MGKSYRDLQVWSLAYRLSLDVYKVALQLPQHEAFGIASQIQRAVVSIPSNIAEGQQRASVKEFKQFLYIARGSAAELSTQLALVQDIYLIDAHNELAQLERIQKMLYGLIKTL